jgi:CheY-like chemotaxis protein
VNPSPDEGVAQEKRILVVDDEPAVTSVIVRFLERAGLYEAVAVNDPTKAVEVAREFRPDLVVLDIVMPIKRSHRDFDDLCRDRRMCRCTDFVSNSDERSRRYCVPKRVGSLANS